MDDLKELEYEFEDILVQSDCRDRFINETEEIKLLYPDGGFCGATFDYILCWPPTPPNQTATLVCSSDLVYFDQSQNATKYCMADGSWTKTDYSECEPGISPEVKIYFIGQFISLITLLIAMGIFTFFKELHCLRNTIHKNLMWSYIFTYTTWIAILIMIQNVNSVPWTCNLLIALYQYFHNTTFFWMFVEGLYLYILVVKTMTRRTLMYKEFAIVGWGLPMVFLLIWVITKLIVHSPEWCSWMEDHMIDWTNYAAQLIVLIANVYFLLSIMWVLITKLRTANTAEIRQSFKAAKALLVLIPLLGITYLITIYAPTPAFAYTRAIMLSSQGFVVALLYCFMNAEVQRTLLHHYENWKASRSVGSNRGSSGNRSNNWWSRSRNRSHSMRRHTEWTLVHADELHTPVNHTNLSNGTDVPRADP